MKLFFGGSMKRFETNRDEYLTIRQVLLAMGHTLTRDWVKLELDGKVDNHNTYFKLVQKAIGKSDAVILDANLMHSSVGEQLMMAMEKNVPTLLLINSQQPSDLHKPSDLFIDKSYLNLIKLDSYTDQNLESILKKFLDWAAKTRPIVRFNLEIDKKMNEHLLTLANTNGSSKASEIRRLILQDIKS